MSLKNIRDRKGDIKNVWLPISQLVAILNTNFTKLHFSCNMCVFIFSSVSNLNVMLSASQTANVNTIAVFLKRKRQTTFKMDKQHSLYNIITSE